MRTAVVTFPGSNRDRDAIEALRLVTGQDPAVVWHADSELPKVDLIVVPGGFSYGDYLRCGAMAARTPAMREVVRAAAAGCHVLGICNGFQILTEAGLLPGALLRNANLRFICHNAWLKVEATNSAFTAHYRPGQTISVPVAHGDGNYFADPETFRRIEGEGLVAFRYSDEAGRTDRAANPNGSLANVAGIFNERRTVLGLMPHPECAVDPLVGSTDGRPMFEALAEALG